MRHRFLESLGALTLVSLLSLGASTAQAHIDLLEPEARAHGTAARGDTEIDVNSNLKSGPCGQVTSGRSSRVATYAPGETITVRVREENAHVSYLRVSIDLDGEEFPLRSMAPPAPETQEEALAAEVALGADGLLAVVREDNDTPGFVHEIAITLPEVTCTSCTLQVMQFMYDDPAAPFYFQCADLVLSSVGAAPDAGAPPDAGAAGTASLAAAGAPFAAPDGASVGGTPGSSQGGAGGTPAVSQGGAGGRAEADPARGGMSSTSAGSGLSEDADATGDSSSCSVSHGAPGSLPSFALVLAALGLRRARRR